MGAQLFDLNIETVLEHWDVEHAIRELIANALDEQAITGTADIEIVNSGSAWLVRDHGRGLRIEHFTLNENVEKLSMPDRVIGKFGGGLKDALATFHRHAIPVTLRSPHGVFTLRAAEKHGFSAISTLHVAYERIAGCAEGTEIELRGVSAEQISAAQALFVRFADERVLDRTRYGDVLACTPGAARIYISGVLVNEEPDFIFSYNVTSITPAMRKRLNRERTTVGRTTYAARVKAILLSATSDEVNQRLADQVLQRAAGQQGAELGWAEVRDAAFRLYAQRNEVAFVTEEHLREQPEIIDHMRSDGIEPAVITAADEARITETGTLVRTFADYVEEYNDSFQYTWVNPHDLDAQEADVLARADEILDLVALGDRPSILISSTMRICGDSTLGVWDSDLGVIVIERSQLQSLSRFAGILLHEAAHYMSGAPDVSRAFESKLTEYLGQTAVAGLRSDENSMAWIDALGRYADAHLALRDLVVDIESGEIDDVGAAYHEVIEKSRQSITTFDEWRNSNPPQNIRSALLELLSTDGRLTDRLESSIKAREAQSQTSTEPVAAAVRRCKACGTPNRIPLRDNRLVRCGRCKTELGPSL